MLSYNNDPALKVGLLREIEAHERADQIIKGTYGERSGPQWRGCAVGCALHSLNRVQGRPDVDTATGQHDRFETELGIPIDLAYLVDHVFESLPLASAVTWPRRFAEAVPVGRDLTRVIPRVLDRLLLDPKIGLIVLAKNDRERAAFQAFAEAVQRDWKGDTLSDAAWDRIDAELLASGNVWARAGAGAWAGARADYYETLSSIVLDELAAAEAHA